MRWHIIALMAERQRQQIDPEAERQVAVQNELAFLDYWQREAQYREIEPAKFPHLDKFEVALARFSTADNYANNVQIIRHMVVNPEVQTKLDILTTSLYRESEERLNQDLGDMPGEPDLELIRRRAALVISSDFNSSLDRAIRDGDEKRIDRSNFPGLRAMDDRQILHYKLEAMDNLITFLEKMEKECRPEHVGFNEKEKSESTTIRERFEKDLKKARQRRLELAKQYYELE